MTTRTYTSPQTFKQALEQRLRTASKSGVDFARRRQLLVFDRFLARIVAVLGDAVLLKGGLVLELRLERARTTKDIDLRLTLTANSDVRISPRPIGPAVERLALREPCAADVAHLDSLSIRRPNALTQKAFRILRRRIGGYCWSSTAFTAFWIPSSGALGGWLWSQSVRYWEPRFRSGWIVGV
jgi:hypothetical protein